MKKMCPLTYDKDAIYHPMSPTLTLRSILQTPSVRGKLALEIVPGPFVSLLKSYGVEEVGAFHADLEPRELIMNVNETLCAYAIFATTFNNLYGLRLEDINFLLTQRRGRL